jgi:hypothetical protein
MKYQFQIKEVNRIIATDFVQERHYSKVMPKLTKHWLGCFLEEELVGIVTLGWGTQPLQTIKKLFPDLKSGDYYEIGKMCMDEKMPKNSESQMLSAVVKWMKKNLPEKKFLFTWADGIVGKVGYVYQGSNFNYGGFIWTDIYISPTGEKIHPRSSKSLLKENAEFLGKDKLFWMTPDFMAIRGIRRIRGKQFRYIYPLNKEAKKILTNKSTVSWQQKYPKEVDLLWKEQMGKGLYVNLIGKPEMDLSIVEYNEKNVNAHKKNLNDK